MTMPNDERGQGLLGLNVNLRLGEIVEVIGELKLSLGAVGEGEDDRASASIRKLKESALELKSSKEQEGGKGQPSDVYDHLIEQLRAAARAGYEEARALLEDLGEEMEPSPPEGG
jgi:hypothetical protein